MSMDNLLNAECFYYDRDVDYRSAIKAYLKEHNLPLRRQDTDVGPNTISLDTIVKAHARMRGTIRKHREVAFV